MDSHRFILLFKMKFIKANVIFLTFINLILDKLKTIALVCQRFQLETVFWGLQSSTNISEQK